MDYASTGMAEDTERQSGDGLAKAIDPTKLGPGTGSAPVAAPTVFRIEDLTAYYGKSPAVKDVSFEVPGNQVTAIIGPSGCGKSTFIRCLNRMNDVVPNFRTEGAIYFHGIDLQGKDVDPVNVRRQIGMVFQRPNPFPKSVFDNIAYGLRILGMKDNLRRPRRGARSGARRCGRRSRTGSRTARSRSRAASSSACASRARSRSSPR